MQRDRDTLNDRKQMFGRSARNYLLDEDKINIFRAYFAERPETIFRTETNEVDKKDVALRDSLNLINSCFVNGNADGINELMKKTEDDPELSNLKKLRVINECRAALFDLNRN